ncbi:MAG: class I SAM-dependent methyltransferase [Bacteroidota bacterium]
MDSSGEFSFKEIDKEGMETLEAMSVAPGFNEWMYQTVCSRLTGKVLEIGSGIGNISQYFLRDGRSIHLSDIRSNYCGYLQDRYGDSPNLEAISMLDLTHPEFDSVYQAHMGQFDGLFALNVVEHIQDDGLAIANARKLLRPGGRMVILVPAFQFLYNQFDESLEHYRRYNKAKLSQLLRSNNLELRERYYFNVAGMPGWFLFGNLLKRKVIPSGPVKVFNTLVPLFKFADWLMTRWMGLSVVVEATRPDTDR